MEVGVITELSGEQACISVWNLTTGVRLKIYKNCTCGRNAFDFVSSNYLIAAQHDKQLLQIYDTQNERLIKRIVCPGKISALVVTPDSNYCVVALMEKMYIWHISTGNLINIISKHYQNITSMKFTTDGSLLVTCGEDNLVLVWKFADMLQPRDPFADRDVCDEPLHSLMKHSMPIQGVHVGVNGMRASAVTCSIDQTCVLFDLCTGKVVCTFVFDVGCSAVAMDAVERRLLTGTLDGSIYCVNSHTVRANNQEVHVQSKKGNCWKAHDKSVNSLSITSDGTKLLSGGLDCKVKLWHITNQQCLKVFDFKGEISNIFIKPFDRVFEQRDQTAKVKPSIGNFKRTVFQPGNFAQLINPYEMDEEDSLFPVVLQDVGKHSADSCMLPRTEDEIDSSDLVNRVLMSCMPSKTMLNCLEPKSATRSELLEGVLSLEAMTKKIHTHAVEKLLNVTENEDITEKGPKHE